MYQNKLRKILKIYAENGEVIKYDTKPRMHKEKIDKFDYNPPPQICTWQKLLNQSGGEKKERKRTNGAIYLVL